MSFVYLLEEVPLPGESVQPWTKIGYTKNPAEWRLNANLKRGNPRELRFGAVYEFPTERDGRVAEAAAHKTFAEHRGLKEWFQMPWQTIDRWCVGQGDRHRGTAELPAENNPSASEPVKQEPDGGSW